MSDKPTDRIAHFFPPVERPNQIQYSRALLSAIQYNHIAMVIKLIEDGADPSYNDCVAVRHAIGNVKIDIGIRLAAYIHTNGLLENHASDDGA